MVEDFKDEADARCKELNLKELDDAGTFTVLIKNGNIETVEERNYLDIWHVNFWTNQHGNPVY